MTTPTRRTVLWLASPVVVAAMACGGASDSPDSGDRPDAHVDAAPSMTDAEAGEDVGDPSDAGHSTEDGGDGGPPGLPPAEWCGSDDTVLGHLAAGLDAGGWAELPESDSLDALELHHHLVTWTDTAVWNPRTRRVQWVGSPGSCCADPAAYRLLRYDVATHTWSVHDTPWGDDTGHAYDGNALDPETGVHYFARGGDVRGLDGGSWNTLPELPFDGPVAPAVTWFRDLGGDGALVYVGSRDRVATYAGGEWQRIEAEVEGWGGYHMFAEHNPVHDVVWLGAGNDGVRRSYMLDPDLDLTELEDAPVSLNASGASLKTYDPATGDFIVRHSESRTWYAYDIAGDEWTDITDAVQADLPASWDPDDNMFVTAIDDCGVLFFFAHANEDRRAYIYRHAL